MIQLLVITLLTLLSCWRIISFTFWKDDWPLLWGALHHFETFRAYWSHPATVIEFMWLTKIFNTNPLPWMVTGILLRIFVALALMKFAKQLTKSDMVAWLSGIFFAVSVAGIDAVGWPSAHVVLISSILLLTGLTFLLEKRYMLFTVFTGVGFAMDPFRNFPVFLIILLLNRTKFVIRLIISGFLVLLLTIIPFNNAIMRSHLFAHFKLEYIISKYYYIGNLINSLVHLFAGWLAWFREYGSTGEYNRIWTRVGIVCFVILAGLLSRLKKPPVLGLIWAIIFYIPNWLFEPRLTMGITHRYMVISNIGFILFLSQIISKISNKKLIIITALFFIITNVSASWYYTGEAALYRNKDEVKKIWNQVNQTVPPKLHTAVFVYSGEDPVRTFVMDLSGGYPFALIRGNQDVPVTTNDDNYLDTLVCVTQVPLNHVFSFQVTNSGDITIHSAEQRKNILLKALNHSCVPIIDQEILKEN